MKEIVYHKYSVEYLYHFNCGECKNWWSYASTETRYEKMVETMTCPHCGSLKKIIPNSNLID